MGWDGSNDWGRRKRVQIALDENDDDTALLALAARPGKARRQGKVRYLYSELYHGRQMRTQGNNKEQQGGLERRPTGPTRVHNGIHSRWAGGPPKRPPSQVPPRDQQVLAKEAMPARDACRATCRRARPGAVRRSTGLKRRRHRCHNLETNANGTSPCCA
ncbi:hypothetical protein VFPFJ_10002 [Purpureocillium lilacinum]|uniref:Uncharacterized protein n=1 Tax=Purpureocillium lilacinum TaxID=33203 RepID=A0A179GNM5_PURLI|nr:hypothetical protein VFPFJ_10002 [Purpureocillium lilacinum]OAQ79516.1 hypothetical protein VFPFJ_10002 [Purpureocillium lilacinum]